MKQKLIAYNSDGLTIKDVMIDQLRELYLRNLHHKYIIIGSKIRDVIEIRTYIFHTYFFPEDIDVKNLYPIGRLNHINIFQDFTGYLEEDEYESFDKVAEIEKAVNRYLRKDKFKRLIDETKM